MKTTVKTVAVAELNKNSGRAAYVHALRAKKVAFPKALAKTREEFQCSKSLFARIWKRGEHEVSMAA